MVGEMVSGNGELHGLNFMRQQGIIPPRNIVSRYVSVVGVGGIGSFVALTLAKMGVGTLEIYDEDGVDSHNLPNQFYRKKDVTQFKVDALREIIGDFADSLVAHHNRHFDPSFELQETVVVATDSMRSRRMVWEAFQKSQHCVNYIEARMGAQLGMVYTIKKSMAEKGYGVEMRDKQFYEGMLYDDSQVPEAPCTERAIIYNVLMIASLVSRSYKAIVTNEVFPRELIFNMTTLDQRSLMMRM